MPTGSQYFVVGILKFVRETIPSESMNYYQNFF